MVNLQKNDLRNPPLLNAKCGLSERKNNTYKRKGISEIRKTKKNKAYEEILVSPKHYTYSLRIPIIRSWLQKSI